VRRKVGGIVKVEERQEEKIREKGKRTTVKSDGF
jgi:hypothetical protein